MTDQDRETRRKYLRQPLVQASRMLSNARIRAKRRGVPCTITKFDFVIPERCPWLDIPLERNWGGKGQTPNSPALDCVVPELGYIPGNVIVVSSKANQIKSNATWQEIMTVAKAVRKLTK